LAGWRQAARIGPATWIRSEFTHLKPVGSRRRPAMGGRSIRLSPYRAPADLLWEQVPTPWPVHGSQKLRSRVPTRCHVGRKGRPGDEPQGTARRRAAKASPATSRKGRPGDEAQGTARRRAARDGPATQNGSEVIFGAGPATS
jgi:hypothetical protein